MNYGRRSWQPRYINHSNNTAICVQSFFLFIRERDGWNVCRSTNDYRWSSFVCSVCCTSPPFLSGKSAEPGQLFRRLSVLYARSTYSNYNPPTPTNPFTALRRASPFSFVRHSWRRRVCDVPFVNDGHLSVMRLDFIPFLALKTLLLTRIPSLAIHGNLRSIYDGHLVYGAVRWESNNASRLEQLTYSSLCSAHVNPRRRAANYTIALSKTINIHTLH